MLVAALAAVLVNERVSNLQLLIPLHPNDKGGSPAAALAETPYHGYQLDRELSTSERDDNTLFREILPRLGFPHALVDSKNGYRFKNLSTYGVKHVVHDLNGTWRDLVPDLKRIVESVSASEGGREPAVQMYYLGGEPGQPDGRLLTKFRPAGSRRATLLQEEYPGMLRYYLDRHRKSRAFKRFGQSRRRDV